jgi:hypothetical protein
MIKLNIKVTYQTGQAATYLAALPEWSKWERKTGKSVYAIESIKDFQQADFLFLAHAAYVREAAGKPTKPYDVWELGVDSVEVGDYDDPKATSSEALTESAGN